jgi:hypothetical protein
MPDPPTNPTEPAKHEPAEQAAAVRQLVHEIGDADAAPSRPWQCVPTRLALVALAEAAGLPPRRPAPARERPRSANPTLTRPADEHLERGTADDHKHQRHEHDE